MHAHRVEIFNRANDNAIVRFIANNFHFKFFPTQNAFFNKHFIRWRGVDAAFDDFNELGLIISDAAASAAKRERRAYDGGQTNVFKSSKRGRKRFDVMGARRRQANFRHGFAEELSVFRLIDRVRSSANHFNVKLFQNAHFFQRQGAI